MLAFFLLILSTLLHNVSPSTGPVQNYTKLPVLVQSALPTFRHVFFFCPGTLAHSLLDHFFYVILVYHRRGQTLIQYGTLGQTCAAAAIMVPVALYPLKYIHLKSFPLLRFAVRTRAGQSYFKK